MNIRIKDILKQLDIDCYLIYDFRGSNYIGRRIIEFTNPTTRRWIALYTKDRELQLVIPKLEESIFADVQAEKHIYATYEEMQAILKKLLSSYKTIAMDFSPENGIPVIDVIPHGFYTMVQSINLKAKLVSSADLTQYLSSTWNKTQYASHKTAALLLTEIVQKALSEIKGQMKSGKTVTDYDIEQFILGEYKKNNLVTEPHLAVVATDMRASNPHYWPTEKKNYVIKPNSLLLLDIWAKLDEKDAIFADITQMAWIGPEKVPTKVQEVWEVVRDARDIGIEYVMNHAKKDIQGYEVDREVRKYIESKGYGKYFVHRTGHSIDSNDHGNGANIDDYETHDLRVLLPHTGFSIEPGIYLPEFGVRSEINMYISEDKKGEVTTPRQTELFIV